MIPVQEIVTQIDAIPDCRTLAAFEAEVLQKINDQLRELQQKLADMLKLQDPATFIANMIAQIAQAITDIRNQIQQIQTDISTIQRAIDQKKMFLNC